MCFDESGSYFWDGLFLLRDEKEFFEVGLF